MAHRPATLRRAATARAGASKCIVDSQLFSRFDFPETIQEDLATNSAHGQIRITAMVDEFSAAPAYGPIENREPIPVNRISAHFLPCPQCVYDTTREFTLADPLSGVPDDLLARRNRFLCEDTKPLDTRPANNQLKTRKLRFDRCSVTLRRHNYRAKCGEDRQKLVGPLTSLQLPRFEFQHVKAFVC